MFRAATEYALQLHIPVFYLAANSGARVGLANEVKQCLKVEWHNPEEPQKGFKYLYLSDDDYHSITGLKSDVVSCHVMCLICVCICVSRTLCVCVCVSVCLCLSVCVCVCVCVLVTDTPCVPGLCLCVCPFCLSLLDAVTTSATYGVCISKLLAWSPRMPHGAAALLCHADRIAIHLHSMLTHAGCCTTLKSH